MLVCVCVGVCICKCLYMYPCVCTNVGLCVQCISVCRFELACSCIFVSVRRFEYACVFANDWMRMAEV